MTHVCAWCGKQTKPEDGTGTGVSHDICFDCAMEEAYTRGWNDALHKLESKLSGWKREWGGAPVIPMRDAKCE